jgi:hypothetical protein
MGNEKPVVGRAATDPTGERDLRGELDRQSNKKKRNPDAVVRVDDEEDTLYSDDLEVEDDTAPLGTDRGEDDAR